MDKQVEELRERVRLTDEGIQISIDDWRRDRYHGKTEDTSSMNYTLKAQLNKVLNDRDLALIDREKGEPALNEEYYARKGYYLMPKGAFFGIPLAEALKEVK